MLIRGSEIANAAANALETAAIGTRSKFIFSIPQRSPALYSTAQPIGARDGEEAALRVRVSSSNLH
jgi:hypothetical protein